MYDKYPNLLRPEPAKDITMQVVLKTPSSRS